MIEGQYLEWKSSWHDDHLNVAMCALANADGGVLEIGRDGDCAVVDRVTATQAVAERTAEQAPRTEPLPARKDRQVLGRDGGPRGGVG